MIVNQRVSDIITLQDIREWQSGDIISITSGTGTGKSYLIKNMMYPIAKSEGKKILYLVNRKRLKEQFDAEIREDKKDDVIDIMLYQKVESYKLYDETLKNLKEKYLYIVCDEFHYFVSDASFNHKTDLSLNAILDATDRIRILMSATSDFVIRYLENEKKLEIKKRVIDYHYNFLDKVYFYEKDEIVKKFLFELEPNEKVIFFCHSAEKAHSLSVEFSDSLFVCSESNKDYKKHLNKEKISDMLNNEYFNEQMLFTTPTLDNGINLKDKKLKYIVVDIQDLVTLIQCIGRKRIIDESDKVALIIKNLNNKSIGGRITQLNKRLEMADYLLRTNTREFIKKYPRQDHSRMIFETFDENGSMIKVVNDLMYAKCVYDIEMFNNFLSEENGFQNKVLNILERENCGILEDHYGALTLKDYLIDLTNKKMFKYDQKSFKEIIKQSMVKTSKGSSRSLGIHTINGHFKDLDLNFQIQSKREKEQGDNRDKTYWIISELKSGS